MGYTVFGSQGAVDYPGDGAHQIVGNVTISGPQAASGSMTVTSFPHVLVSNVITASTNLTFALGGFYVLSSSTTQITATLPDPGSVPGARFIFRAGSAHAHGITGSVGGFTSFVTSPGITTTGTAGSKIALAAVQNSSVFLESDGYHYVVSAASGTCTISQA
jgi:hypothetical protein